MWSVLLEPFQSSELFISESNVFNRNSPVGNPLEGGGGYHGGGGGGEMRSRTNSGVRLDYYQRLLYRTILCYQVIPV